MESAVKIKLDADRLNALARHAFGADAAEACELTDGWANTAYRIRLADGRQTVLKVAPPPDTLMMRYEKNIMQTEVGVLRFLEGKLPVPQVYAYDTSFAHIGLEYFFMEHLDGEPYNKVKASLTEAERERIELELGRYNRMINGYVGTRFGPYAQPSAEGDWPEVFMRMMKDVLADGRDVSAELPMTEEEVVRLVERHRRELAEVTVPQLVHWDLWDGNVFVKNGSITGIIDFERALWGDPLMESYFSRLTDSSAFLRGYGCPELPAAGAARRRLYDLYLDLIMHIECTFRQYDNPKHIRWARENLLKGWELARAPAGE